MISSELPEVLHLSNRIVVMCAGRGTGIAKNSDADEKYSEKIARNARKNLAIAKGKQFTFSYQSSIEGIENCYNIIKINRKERGFPLKMKLEQLLETTKLIKADGFLLSLENIDVASAIVFHVAPNVTQVIYWGDIPSLANNKTMNYLAWKVFDFYRTQTNVLFTDIGPSSDAGFPSNGLCDFKESIGCKVSSKFTLIKIL